MSSSAPHVQTSKNQAAILADQAETCLCTTAWIPNTDLINTIDWQHIFKTRQPIELELGCGDGSFIIEKARRHPDINFVAVERLLGRIRKVVKAAERENLPNLKALRLESSYIVRFLIPPHSIRVVYLMFPDPWPKRRHAKNRLVQTDFLKDVHRILESNGKFRLTTDHEEYFEHCHRIFDAASQWKKNGIWNFSEDPLSDFQKTFQIEGRKEYRCEWMTV